jgi:tRNA C32,U32 (ribose-2'-O)-methylase TrmJ
MYARSTQSAIRLHGSGLAMVFGANDCQLKNETLPNAEFFNTIGRKRSFSIRNIS